MSVESLLTDNIANWALAVQNRTATGRGSSKKIDLYGIKKLRELVLELAVQGKLVLQNPEDEPASVLLERIAAEKAKLVKSKDIKKPRKLPDISEDDKPFEIPAGWVWARLQDIGRDWGQKKPDQKFTYIDVGAINKEFGYIHEPAVLEAGDAPSRARKLIKEGTVIYSTVRPYLLNIAVINQAFDPEPIASTAFAIIHPLCGMSGSFIYRYLRSPSFVEYVEGRQTGVAYPAINDKQFFSGLIPIPPEAEQPRIEAKVNELMSLCDQLEQQTETSLAAHTTLVENLFATLTSSTDAAELEQNWHRIAEHFTTLFTTEESIDQLKQTVLQLAVTGKLTDSKDALTHSSILNEVLPSSWNVKPLNEISASIVDCPHSTPKWTDNGVICVRTNQFSPRSLNLNDVRYVSEETYSKRIKRLTPQENDILYSREGGILGIACRIPADAKLCMGQRMMLIRTGEEVIPEYLEIVLNSPLITNIAKQKTTGGAAPRVNVATVKAYPIPVPPITTQREIIAKVNLLDNVGDKINTHLQQAQQTRLHLADAMVAQSLT